MEIELDLLALLRTSRRRRRMLPGGTLGWGGGICLAGYLLFTETISRAKTRYNE